MALIDCPECGGKVSTAAATCPHCGYPINQNAPASFPTTAIDETWSVELPFAGHAEYRNGLANELFRKGFISDSEKTDFINNTSFPFELKTGISKKDALEIKKIVLNNHLPVKIQSCFGDILHEAETERASSSFSADNAPVARCPFCGSTSIQAIKKGYGVGKAAVGVAFLGPVGLLGGALGSGQIQRVCLSCGKKF